MFGAIVSWWKRFNGIIDKDDQHTAGKSDGYKHPVRHKTKAPRAKRNALWGYFGDSPVYANGTTKCIPGVKRILTPHARLCRALTIQ